MSINVIQKTWNDINNILNELSEEILDETRKKKEKKRKKAWLSSDAWQFINQHKIIQARLNRYQTETEFERSAIFDKLKTNCLLEILKLQLSSRQVSCID